MQRIPYTTLDEIERDRAEMDAFRKELEDSTAEETESRAVDDMQTFECEKCGKKLTEDEVAPWRSIDPKTGGNIFIIYCEPCYNALIKKIYGFDL
jgi:hypothetical protein